MIHSNYRKTRRQNPLPDDLEEGGFEAKVGAAAIRLQAGQTEEEVEADLVLNHGVDGPMAMLITRAARVLLSEWEPKSERDTKPDMRVAASTPAPAHAGRGSRVLLGPTDDQVLQAIDSHAGAFVDMAPVDFLRLTTLDEDHIRKVQSEAHDLAKYEKHMESGKCEVHPFLRIDVKSGQVVGHDGRHRAAAILSADPDAQMRVALIPVPLSKTASMADIPETIKGEYDPGFRLKIRKNVTVVDANVQQGCAGCGKPAPAGPKEKKAVFQDTVLRRDAKGQLFLMNRPEKGWSSYGIPYPSEQAVLDEWDVTIGPWTSDKHSAFAPVKKNRKGNPVRLTEAQEQALSSLSMSGSVVTHSSRRESGKGGQVGHGSIVTDQGEVEVLERHLASLERCGLVKRVKSDKSVSTEPSYRGHGGTRVWSTSTWWEITAAGMEAVKKSPAREPLASYRNDETGMESYVVNGKSPGKYNVTMRDLDSGEWVPGARIGISSLDEAKALAQKWAGVRLENPVKKPKINDAWSALGLARPKPIAEDKLAVLLPKLRKGADSSLTAAQVISVAQALGWTVEPMVYVAIDQPPFTEKFYTHHLSAAEDHRSSLLARALPGPPEALAPGERAVWNVGEIESWPMSDSPTGHSYRVTSDQAEGVVGLRFIDTYGKVIDYVPDAHARRSRWKGKSSPTVMDAPGFMLLSGGSGRASLRDASSWLDDINRRLGTEPHVSRPRTREGTATCWFCWRNIKMTPNGLLVHHGYQRPGTGEIQGDCLGVHRKPYELAVDPGQEALAAHQRSAENHRDEAARLRSGSVTEMYRRSRSQNGNDIVVPSGEPGWGETQEGKTVRVGTSAWADMIDSAARRHESRADSEEAQVALYQHAVDSWQKRPLPTEKDFEFDHLFRLMKEAREKA